MMTMGGRYRIEREIGRGGMAAVYEATDLTRDARVALKRLHAERAEGDAHFARLFEHEYRTLVQLAHPRVVSVLDYQRGQDGVFYTMELLDGGDLRERAPLPWQRACALICDVASALSLLHSRRLVHRDVTPRNIRCTSDGKAKLIDFGAMVPFGSHSKVVGTPPFTAPEVMHGQTLDARTDLFALGATAYFVLTGRHAYPARSFRGLRNAWRSSPVPPTRLAPDVPAELEQLVMSLLHLSAAARPRSAIEVVERLSGLAELELDEQLLARQAFLATPTLVGRDAALFSVRKALIRAARGRGSASLVTGPPGIGRSRFVDACVLEGKLAGALTLRAEAHDAGRGAWAGVCALLEQLEAELGARFLAAIRARASVLAHVWPRALALGQAPPRAFDDPRELRPAVLETLRDLMLELCEQTLLLVTADDLTQIDEPSAAAIALLAQETRKRRMMVIAASAHDPEQSDSRALVLLSRSGHTLRLSPLTAEDSERLMISVFGEVPHVRLVADRLHQVGEGMPRSLIDLAQHLLDHDIVRYKAGGWALPARIDTGDLPSSVSAVLQDRLKRLRPPAYELAAALALCGKSGLSLEQCRLLSPERSPAELLATLDELVAAQVLGCQGERYVLSQPGWAPTIGAELDPALACELHGRLARMLERSGAEPFLIAEHLLRAGRAAQAIELTLQKVRMLRATIDTRHDGPPVFELPPSWPDTLERLLALAIESGRPPREVSELRGLVLAMSILHGRVYPELMRQHLAHLAQAAGLDIYRELSGRVDESQRLAQALALAQQRHDAKPERERSEPPGEAIRLMATGTAQAIGMMAHSLDYAFFADLPSLEPFAPLSEALRLLHLNWQSTCHLLAARFEQARAGFLEIFERLSQPEGVGLPPVVHRQLQLAVCFGLGQLETKLGIPTAGERIAAIEHDPRMTVNAVRLRVLGALGRGDVDQADAFRLEVERLQLRNQPVQMFEGTDVLDHLLGALMVDDLVRVWQTIPKIEACAERFATWRPVLDFAHGHYQLLRGEPVAALQRFEQAAAQVEVGRHPCWPVIAGAYLTGLVEAGQAARARVKGESMLADARREGLGFALGDLYLPLSQVELALGDLDAASAYLERLSEVTAISVEGTRWTGRAHELRARLAIRRGDAVAFREAAAACAERYRAGKNAALTARYERLVREAQRARLGSSVPQLRALSGDSGVAADDVMTMSTQASGLLSSCGRSRDRAERVLALLAEHGGDRGSFLFVLTSEGPRLVAQRGHVRPPSALEELVSAFLSAEVDETDEVTLATDVGTSTCLDVEWIGPSGERFAPILLCHDSREGLAVTGVVVRCASDEGPAPPSDLVDALSRGLLEAGDVAAVVSKY